MESEIKMIDVYNVEVMLADVSKQLEDLTYRLYTLEDSVAQLNAYKEEEKENA